MSVELVNVRTKDGVRLDGSWLKPASPGKSQFPVDVMILHHGVAGNFYGASPFELFYAMGRLNTFPLHLSIRIQMTRILQGENNETISVKGKKPSHIADVATT